MVSPLLNKKQTKTYTVNQGAKRIFQAIYAQSTKSEEKDDDTPKIIVSEMISKMSFYYEKMRNYVDYNEEYLLRKNAILRILKRQIVIEGVIKDHNGEELAKNLLTELIRAGYLPNNKIPETKIGDIGKIIDRFIKLRNYSLARIKPASFLKSGDVSRARDGLKDKNEIAHWLLALLASEIEENLGLEKEKEAIVGSLYENLTKNIKLPADLPYSQDLDIQIFVSIYRNYLKFDDDMLAFIIFKYYNSVWKKDPKDEDIAKIAQQILVLKQAIGEQIEHPLTKQLNKIVGTYAIYYTTLADVIRSNPKDVYEKIKLDPKAFPRLIKDICNQRYANLKSKLWRAAFRSIIYIFLTKSIFVFLLEIPAIKWFGEEINPVSLAINVTFPAFLLFLIVFFTKVPGDANTAKIVEGIEEISFVESERKEPITLRPSRKRGAAMNSIFTILYTITFFISFGGVVWALDKLHFNFVSITIFLFFLAFVSFFSIRIRKSVKEAYVVEKRENIFSFLIDFFYVPIVLVGKWLSEKVSRLNFIVFFLDFIIEAPFKVFVEVAEEWTKYVKERKEDIS